MGTEAWRCIRLREENTDAIEILSTEPCIVGRPRVHNMQLDQLTPSMPASRTLRLFLVRARCTLARLQLIQVPAADGQVTLVLVHAAAEAGHLLAAHGRRLVLRRLHRFRLLLLGRCRRPAEPSADGVADAGSDGYAAAVVYVSVKFRSPAGFRRVGERRDTYAAVEAI